MASECDEMTKMENICSIYSLKTMNKKSNYLTIIEK